jgi:predicted lipoprotein with Yx(FWY)xxD motif
MKRTLPARLLLVTVLSIGVGLATEMTAAFADPPQANLTTVVAKKKKKATVKIFESDLGPVLVNSKGFTLYAFDPDGTNIEASACTGSCASVWPAAKSSNGKLKVGKGLDPTMLVEGVDGQLAYNSHLLYTYSTDTAAGDTNGNGVGGVWHAVGADGQPLP